MEHASVTSKGQVTIPAKIRKRLGVKPGDRVKFIEEGARIYLARQEDRIEAAFGLFQTDISATSEDIDQAIATGWERRGRR